jgi:mannobiose 2-epimerase
MTSVNQAQAARLGKLSARMEHDLLTDILPFWLPYQDPKGGYCGQIGNDGSVTPKADKGLVMHSRFLWGYSAAFRMTKSPVYLQAARQAYLFLRDTLQDKQDGGFWWVVHHNGRPVMKEKIIYGQAFAIYGLSEYYRARAIRSG